MSLGTSCQVEVQIFSRCKNSPSETSPMPITLGQDPPSQSSRNSSQSDHDGIDELSSPSTQLAAISRDVAAGKSNACTSQTIKSQRASQDVTTEACSAQPFNQLDTVTHTDQEKMINGPCKQRILECASMSVKDRVKHLPQCYDSSGRLKKPWSQFYGAEYSEIRNRVNAKPSIQGLGIEEAPKPNNGQKQLPSAVVPASPAKSQQPQSICQACRTPLNGSRKGQNACSACPRSTIATHGTKKPVIKIRNRHSGSDLPTFPNLVLQPSEAPLRKRLPPNLSSGLRPDSNEAQAQYGVELSPPPASPITPDGSSLRLHQPESSLETTTVSTAPARRTPVGCKVTK